MQSPLRIEYSTQLLGEVCLQGGRGILYGARRGERIRIFAARPAAGFEVVGLFSVRVRGEVFLTESDLEFLEQVRATESDAGVALVIAGKRGGFFVREPDGSMQTLRSYEEILIAPGQEADLEVCPTADLQAGRPGQEADLEVCPTCSLL